MILWKDGGVNKNEFFVLWHNGVLLTEDDSVDVIGCVRELDGFIVQYDSTRMWRNMRGNDCSDVDEMTKSVKNMVCSNITHP